MSTQQDHDEEDCPLCGGAGEVSISKDGTYEGTDYYGCPMCISRERDEEARLIETQRDELLEALNRMVCNPNAPNLAFARAAIAKCR